MSIADTDNVLNVPLASPQSTEAAASRSKINVVLFSGGSGTRSITEALLRHPQISLTILINAYDDGHSTGRLRRFIPGMLGPSDVRKNINRLMPAGERSQESLKTISDHRLPVGISTDHALITIQDMLAGAYPALPKPLAEAFPHLEVWQWKRLSGYLNTFLDYMHRQEQEGRYFDFSDCAIGNLLFAGAYLEQGRDFNRAVAEFSEFYEVGRDVLLNITLGEDLFLVAEKENGGILLSEASIVAAQDDSKIKELFLIDGHAYRSRVENAQPEPAAGWPQLFRESSVTPRLNPHAARALAEADVIVYGPGTQHSSLFPSYMTEGVAEAIAVNGKADKVFVANIHRDFDIQADDADDIAHKLLHSLSRRGRIAVNWRDVVSHFFVQSSEDGSLGRAKYVPFDESKFSFPLDTVKARDWESQEGRHSGGYVLDELQRIVQSRIDIELQQVHHMVSIVVPVLNEAATIEEVLKSVTALDFQPLDLTKEVIVVDGGSSDRTFELAQSVRNVKTCKLTNSFGRGAAMRLGIEKARGNLIVFFPGDNEYRAEDLYTVVNSLARSRFKAVFGTRATKCTDLSERLMRIYENKKRLYVVSKYGGMLLSVVTLFLYNRYVSDVLSSVKGYDGPLLKSLGLGSNGLDLETEIVAKLSRRREYILEMPVEYTPRTRAAGKKITAKDGIKALFALFRFRV